ncbi:MAG: flagellar type III secretion system pore protein FliP [Candidatus Thiodiazotropha endolucinida]
MMKSDKYCSFSSLTILLLLFGLLSTVSLSVSAADIQLPGIGIDLNGAEDETGEVATAIKIVLCLIFLSLAPAIMIVMTSFTRIIVVLAILRHAFGMQQTPPNTVLISLALFLTLFNMLPTLNLIEANAVQPYGSGQINSKEAFQAGMEPLRDFMIRQTREQDLALMVEVSGGQMPQTIDDVSNLQVIPAFMLSELKAAFQIGFVIFLPFVLIDIVVASLLMSMRMLMVPPMMISLPIKILMFVLIDGWHLVVHSLLGSFA